MYDEFRRVWLRPIALMIAIGFALCANDAFAESRWTDRHTTGPFVFQADFSLKRHEALFDELAELQEELVRVLGIVPARERIHVYMFQDESSYRSFMRRQFPDVPYRRALFFKRDGPGMVFAYRQGDLATDLRHECTHALLHASLPMVPLWLDEGLAEYFESPREMRAFDCPHLASLRWNLRLGMMPSLDELERRTGLEEMGAQQYRFSWAWVHFMLHGPAEAHEKLVSYLRDIEAGNPSDRLSERLNRQLPDLESQLVQHFKSWRRPDASTASIAKP